MALGESISGYSSLDCTLRVPKFSLGTLTCWSCRLISLIGDSDIASFFVLHWYICLIWHADCDDRFILVEDSEISISLCFITIFVWDIDMLIVLIVYLISLSIVIMIFAMIVLITLHVWIHCYTSFDVTCRLSRLCILLIVFEHDVCITIYLDSHSLYVYMSDISCTLPDRMSHDCPPFAWLHVACLCGPHFYPPTSNSLGFGHSFHLGSHYCKCEAFCVLVLWPS